MLERTTRSEKLDLRVTRGAKQALQAAAAASHRSVSEFVLRARWHEPTRHLPTGGRSL